MKIFAMPRAIVSLAAVLLCWVGCSPREPAATTWLSAPSSLALAGRQFDKMFVANAGTDAVQVLQLAPQINAIDFVASPARYFPLSIPAGPHPELLAATADGGFVMVVDTITSTVRLIEADALTLAREQNGSAVALPLGPRESQPIAVATWPGVCTAKDAQTACLGRMYALLRHPGLLVAVDVVQQPDQRPSLQVDRVIAVGGAPLDLALHPTKPSAFVTDAVSARVVRIDLDGTDPSSIQSIGIDVPGGPLAVSHDGSLVAVARPSAQDVVFFSSNTGDVSAGTLQRVDANPVWAPAPTCLAGCDQQEPDACQGAHPADLGLCASPDGYRSTLQPYTGLYVGAVPRAILALGGDAFGGAMTEQCNSASAPASSTTFSRAFAIATLDGALLFAGVPDGGTTLAPRLLEQTHCQQPFLQNVGPNPAELAEILASCGELPLGRQRMMCLSNPSQQSTGVALMRGYGKNLTFGMRWEGVLPGGDRSSGGGDIDESGRFVDASAASAFTGLVIQAQTEQHGVGVSGDILEILTEPRRDPECQQALEGGADLCALERRIVAVASDHGGALVLDRPLPAACFERGGAIAYRIRAAESFLAGSLDDSGEFAEEPVRLRPGDSYGPGRLAGASAPLFFTIATDLDIGSGQSACNLYRGNGEAATGMPLWRDRRQTLMWRISEPFSPVRAGQAYDYTGQTQGNLGRMPSGLALTRPQKNEMTRLVVSYSGSDAVLITTPLNTANLAPGAALERLLR